MPGFNPNGIAKENFVEDIAATAAAPPRNVLRVTGRIIPPLNRAFYFDRRRRLNQKFSKKFRVSSLFQDRLAMSTV
jgi:hypothetical protein